ncbi:MAG: hypothetical protein CMK82_11090 [Pseudomonadales bacterium]|uniref:hypothetical protein n=1 Tax=Sphingobium sp. TaxID=1912891 RepID=UPI000C915042|nr:hypothetical protein [Sphingobium sp.]MAS67324.1 hypothetical protein [Pseudomonadales bacterium]
MKQRHMFSLLDQTFTTVHVNIQGDKAIVPEKPRHVKRFEQGDLDPDALRGARWSPPEGQLRTYTYKVPKAWGIKEGDMLVVPARDMLAFANVVKVDEFPVIDVDADFTYQWAVQRIDFEYHNELVENERKFGETIQEVERVKQRESLVNSFRDSLPEGSAARALFEATTISLAPPVPPQAPPAAPKVDEA